MGCIKESTLKVGGILEGISNSLDNWMLMRESVRKGEEMANTT
jgi:hypothetical protein